MDESLKTVVPGEASESDEETPPPTIQSRPKPKPVPDKKEPGASKVVVVSGEASESDEEEDSKLPPLHVDIYSKPDEDLIIVDTSAVNKDDKHYIIGHGTSKYDSLLHRKLRERNIALRRHLVDSVHQMYISSSKDLHNIRLQLHKTQGYLTDVTHNMSILTNDLFKLDNTLDIVTTCTILPDIHFPEQV